VEETRDIRQQIFREYSARRVTASTVAEAGGVLSGIQRARHLMGSLGLVFISKMADGALLNAGQEIARVTGNPSQITQAEEKIIGTLSKSSGIATAARQARLKAGPRCRVVSGGWKKMPPEIKSLVQQAVQDGGIDSHIDEGDFVYLDKNYVRIMGGIREAIQAVNHLERAIVVQIRGEFGPVDEEALEAARMGAAVVMVDTGRVDDLAEVLQVLQISGLRHRIRVAFSGNLLVPDLEALVRFDLDVVDIGYAILDAPCLPMRFDVIHVQ
jgi:nicotinate-nucleotide pyrophosphorylase (carboxylating)